MTTFAAFRPTRVQRKALSLIKTGAKHVLLFGGSRSGKTTVLVMAVIYRAVRFAASRHLICRLRAKDARSSVLRETLIPWLEKTVGTGNLALHVHDNFVTLWGMGGPETGELLNHPDETDRLRRNCIPISAGYNRLSNYRSAQNRKGDT